MLQAVERFYLTMSSRLRRYGTSEQHVDVFPQRQSSELSLGENNLTLTNELNSIVSQPYSVR